MQSDHSLRRCATTPAAHFTNDGREMLESNWDNGLDFLWLRVLLEAWTTDCVHLDLVLLMVPSSTSSPLPTRKKKKKRKSARNHIYRRHPRRFVASDDEIVGTAERLLPVR
jgi:hypothetical protein